MEDRWRATSFIGVVHWFPKGAKYSLCGTQQQKLARTAPEKQSKRCETCERQLHEAVANAHCVE